MIRRIALVTLGLLLNSGTVTSASEEFPFNYGWTLSASSTDPFVNVGVASTDTVTLNLWFFCSQDTSGVNNSHFSINCGLAIEFVDFDVNPGVVLDSLTPPCAPHLSFPNCPRGSLNVGTFRFAPRVKTYEVCLVPTLDGLFETAGCATPNVGEEPAWIGYTTQTDPVPCSNDLTLFEFCDPPASVASSSWGRIKALYLAEPY